MEEISQQFCNNFATKKKLSVILALTFVEMVIIMFTFASCKNRCLKSRHFPHPCLDGGTLYCCSTYNPFR